VISLLGAPDATEEKTVIPNSRKVGASNLLIDLPFLTRGSPRDRFLIGEKSRNTV
jgi:hypothetical protein